MRYSDCMTRNHTQFHANKQQAKRKKSKQTVSDFMCVCVLWFLMPNKNQLYGICCMHEIYAVQQLPATIYVALTIERGNKM